MRAGRLSTFVTVQRSTQTKGAFNEAEDNWAPLFSAWAEKIEEGGREFFENQRTLGEVSVVFQLRNWPGSRVRLTDRVLADERVFDIQAVTEPDRSRLNLACTEHLNG